MILIPKGIVLISSVITSNLWDKQQQLTMSLVIVYLICCSSLCVGELPSSGASQYEGHASQWLLLISLFP